MIIPVKQLNVLSSPLPAQRSLGTADSSSWVGEDASPVSSLVTSTAVMSAIFFCHYLAVFSSWILEFYWELASSCYNSILSTSIFFFQRSLKVPLCCLWRVWGEIWREGRAFVWVVFILRLWWKTIICVPWAIFPCWPTSEKSVFDMPVVWKRRAG